MSGVRTAAAMEGEQFDTELNMEESDDSAEKGVRKSAAEMKDFSSASPLEESESAPTRSV